MSCWASRYIGRRYEPTLADNCLGFAREVQREVYGRELPGMLSLMREAVRGEGIDDTYPELDRPADGCLVVLGDRKNACAHVGVWCGPAGRVVHAESGFGSVVADELGVLRFQWPSVRFFGVPA